MEVIQHTGIPKELLTDQGSVFTSRLNKELCELLGIDHIVTIAYHPQTNRMLERRHACLKGMLMKVQTDPKEWDRMLKYCLLAYRAKPHSATGFFPYKLIHGRNLRGPLEAMRSGWLENQITYSGTVEWVAELRENLTALHKQAYKNEESYKQKSKQAYDQSSKPRSYELGYMVLCNTPGLTGKLHSIWDGPYEVIAKLSDCNYTIAVPNKRSKS